MITVYTWQLRDARSHAVAELRRVEGVLACTSARNLSDKFSTDALLTLCKDLAKHWDASYKLHDKRRQQWFWQVGSEDVAAWSAITNGCRDIVSNLWFVEQGLCHMLPAEFVERLNEQTRTEQAPSPG